jgi:signal transduction histidine kinase
MHVERLPCIEELGVGAMSIPVVALWPLSAAFLSALLGLAALFIPRTRTRETTFFILLNTATTAWALAYALQLILAPELEPGVAGTARIEYWLFVTITFGIAGAPTYWFLFAAEHAGKTWWTTGWRLLMVHVPMIYTLAVAVTNPWHSMFVDQTHLGAETTYGPLAPPHQIMTFVLVIGGTYLLVSSEWRTRTRSGRRQAVVLLVAALLPMVGGMLWTTRHATGLDVPVNLTPVLFPVLNLVLAYHVLRTGLANVIPVAAGEAFRTMADAAIVTNRNNIVVTVNPATERLLPEIELGQDLTRALPVAALHPRGFESYREFELSRGEHSYWGRVLRIRDRGQRPAGSLVLLTDVTELRSTQARLVELNQDLEAHVTDLEKARARAEARRAELAELNEELSEATKAKSAFLANMSHELRTPLNSIIGFTGVVLDGMAGELNEEQHKQLDMAYTSARHLLLLINDVLDLAKIEAGKLRVELAWTEVGAVVDSVAAKTRPLADDKGVDLRVEAPREPLQLYTDQLRLEQILLNLVSNAIKFTDHGMVTLSAHRDPGGLVSFVVADTGIGIPAERLESVFREFEQVVPGTGAKPRGTGLGLSISRSLAGMLGGDITVESVVGEGSRFTVSVPEGLEIGAQPASDGYADIDRAESA